jgi:HAD superfamily hydrolase (TIGR01549 family)
MDDRMATKEKPVSNIFFDFGGVLADSRKIEYGNIDRLHYDLMTLKIRIPCDELEGMIIGGDKEYESFRQKNSLDVTPTSLRVSRFYLKDMHLTETLANEVMCMVENAFTEITLKKGSDGDAEEVLRELKSRSYRLGLISNTKSDRVKRFMRGSGLSKFMETEVYSSDLGARKPRPEIFNAALNGIGVRAEESAYIGDTLHKDMDGARNVGFKVKVLFRNKGDLTSPLPADVHPIGKLNTLLEIFR